MKVIVRCQDVYGGYSESSTEVVVTTPNIASLDLNAFSDQVSTFEAEQNMDQLVSFTTIFMTTVKAAAASLNDDQKNLQNELLIAVSHILRSSFLSDLVTLIFIDLSAF